jgi:hypothetical protein
MDRENVYAKGSEIGIKSEFKKFIPGQSVDCVIISYENHRLYVLLLKWKGVTFWSLPGGFIYKDEDMDTAAARVLEQRTGLEFPYLTQFHTFGKNNRTDDFDINSLLKTVDQDSPAFMEWLSQRFNTTGYIALINKKNIDLVPDMLSDRCEWLPVDELPKMIFDHRLIIEKAMEKLKIQINYLPIGIELLPERFTMKDLQMLYESLLHKKLDRSNFQRKILKIGILERIEKLKNGGAHKAPYLYRFDKRKYNKLLESGIGYTS